MYASGMPDISSVEGFLSEEEARGLFEYARKAGPGVLEIGVYYGRSTIALAGGRKACGGTPVYAVDHGCGNSEHKAVISQKGTWPKAMENLKRFSVLGNTVPIMMSSLHARVVLDSLYWSFVFIDGGHERLSVLSDAVLWLPRVYPGGLIAFHDYSPAGHRNVVPAVDAVSHLLQLEKIDQIASIAVFAVEPGAWV